MNIRVLELCADYGSQALALKNLGLKVYSEIAEFDKYASQAYIQLHGETKNYGDIYTIDETKLPYFDMVTYSTPCQDFSTVGKQLGGDKGSGTRSSLLWECERIIRAVKPKYLLMENVKNLLSKKHCHTFNEWFKVLESMGYKNYYQVLNAKDYGIPQNRERMFCVSILGGGQYLFPNPIPLEKRVKDILEPIVDEKYYVSDRFASHLLKVKDYLGYKPAINKEVAVTITTKSGNRTSDNYILEYVASRGIATDSKVNSDNYRIRKLTPRECFRLMGVKDEQFDRLCELSNTQLYKLAGNSIVVNVLEAIFKNLLMPEQTDTTGQLTLI